MRTLLVDNHDSYTYNLFHLLARVNGSEPDVRANDDTRPLDLAAYDNVVLSPGPGHPGRARDFGLCADVLARARVPVLGVCLGHQGIALARGADVVRAPRPRHGHIDVVRHYGDPLFAGIPAEFEAVRYHSLCVAEPLPDGLVVLARSADGVVMALREVDRPRWGVQFHPESVASSFGLELIANFRDATPAAATAATAEPIAPAAPASPPRYRTKVAVLDAAVDTESAFGRLYGDSPTAFWLDSARVERGTSRFSFLGDASGPLAETLTHRVDEGLVRVDGVPVGGGSVFDHLRAELARRTVEVPDRLPFDFVGGYVGWFGYELGSATGRRAATPDAAWLFADRFVAVDHEADRTYLVALATGPATEAAAVDWLAETAAVLALPPEPSRVDGGGASRAGAGAGPPRSRLAPNGLPEHGLARTRADYLDDVRACQELLRAGESYELCLTTEARVPATEPALDTYRRLRRINPAPYAAFLRLGGAEVACSSPERFLRVGVDRVVETKPIKGTAPRGATPAEDADRRAALAADPKARAENLMVVDLLRNDLGRVCRVGSVHVPSLMAVETYETVHQLVSTVRGELRPGQDAVTCVRACFPGGSMTGAPKVRAMELLDAIEDRPRGVYSGALGWLSATGAADLAVVIRTMALVDGHWHIGAGGAVVLDSDPAAEYDEMLLKAAAPMSALPPGHAGRRRSDERSAPVSGPGHPPLS
ncbi:aminodeoxychorismate synthase component I [Actinokineospora pegani]|uniref:aminodeoxychorismate synthase component I n=1 Tax=Actinokineospora pegani TaxID=2654637 RepID=UPI0012EA4AAA|nr:aminodeoxychorismate synthase component I [Actinokineospora pegani]